MLLSCWLSALLAVAFVGRPGEETAPAGESTHRAVPAEERTAIDRYVRAPDDSYAWSLAGRNHNAGASTFVIDLTSQTWLSPDEVDRIRWQHWLVVVKPDRATSSTALLFIGGGRNGREKPGGADERLLRLALATNSVVAEIGQIPNQPLVFDGDGQPRVEDDLIGYTWDRYLKTGDERWPARLPMVKAVVRAMDAIQALLARDDVGGPAVDRFTIAGGSKRGWTTWMTAAVDRRVAAIAPIVIDVLNVQPSMEHHWRAYGFWAPAIGDYVRHRIPERRKTARYADLMTIEDPYLYRERFTMPKCIINATGDQFFLPDSSQFYFDDLPGEKHLCYVPNGDHSLRETNAFETLIAFQWSIVNDVPRPKFSWTFAGDDTIRVRAETRPNRALLWRATNPAARDFRVETIGRAYTSAELRPAEDGTFTARVERPQAGWTAYLVQLEFDVGGPVPLRLTTPVRIVPDVLPFADQEPPVGE
ncbi:MAG TPA: PhoPQ-activated pathogenicity-related family protein [Planctomycetaceae bacterium]|nr:PhoPQ-activated pathogenicity-related family protein [Planctomycetaceae bacterium]